MTSVNISSVYPIDILYARVEDTYIKNTAANGANEMTTETVTITGIKFSPRERAQARAAAVTALAERGLVPDVRPQGSHTFPDDGFLSGTKTGPDTWIFTVRVVERGAK